MTDYDPMALDFSATRERSWPEFEMLFGYLKKGDRLLDLGCGNGRLRKFLPSGLITKGDYYGFDLSQDLLDIARDRYQGDHFFRGDFADQWPFGADQFEVIAAIASFHHLLSKKDQRSFFTQALRVLKPGGAAFGDDVDFTGSLLLAQCAARTVFQLAYSVWKSQASTGIPTGLFVGLEAFGQGVGLKVIQTKIFEGRNRVIVFEKI